MADSIPKPEAPVKSDSPETQDELSTEELGRISGGRLNDPCEGGKFHNK